MKIYDFPQYSDDWWSTRRGLPSASNFSKVITTTGLPSKQAQKYMYQLAGEKVSGISQESFQSQAMIDGTAKEEEARELYQIITENKAEQIGLVVKDGYCCSPDALVGDDGLLEIKAPLVATHVGYLLKGDLPKDYFCQVQGQLLVTERKWCDFFSYFPGMKPLIVRVERDEVFIEKLKAGLNNFCLELTTTINKIK